jgi:hypothetical protein
MEIKTFTPDMGKAFSLYKEMKYRLELDGRVCIRLLVHNQEELNNVILALNYHFEIKNLENNYIYIAKERFRKEIIPFDKIKEEHVEDKRVIVSFSPITNKVLDLLMNSGNFRWKLVLIENIDETK